MLDEGDPLRRWEARRVLVGCGDQQGRLLDLTYESGGGELSGRRVTVENMSHVDGALYLEAFCHLRDEARTFAIERICQIVDCATGEVFRGAVAWLESCGLWVRDGEPQMKSLGSDGQGTHNFALRLNLPLPFAGDRLVRQDQSAALLEAFGMPADCSLGEQQAAAILAWWDYAGAMTQHINWEAGSGTLSAAEMRRLITIVISTMRKPSADIALWSVRRSHQPVNPLSLPKMSHFEEIGEGIRFALREMKRQMGRRAC
ncbi:WYL domain-containing protein [Sphingobium sp. ZW T5_29]|uniref:WYL domain-containing protein n=1 Tax=Sphingobium sp. ZW T5_29 TaxID=3378077 RepID=UPI003854D17F